jgi:hypothetical protein
MDYQPSKVLKNKEQIERGGICHHLYHDIADSLLPYQLWLFRCHLFGKLKIKCWYSHTSNCQLSAYHPQRGIPGQLHLVWVPCWYSIWPWTHYISHHNDRKHTNVHHDRFDYALIWGRKRGKKRQHHDSWKSLFSVKISADNIYTTLPHIPVRPRPTWEKKPLEYGLSFFIH